MAAKPFKDVTLDQTNTRRGGTNSAESLVLLAPLDGWAAPLSEVPDPVFAGRMMGDGIAIDPTSSLLTSPCDGEVILLHAARHAITLRAANGAEILMHIGLDTVGLGGKGFTVHVREGQNVIAGEKLISFDLETLGGAAKSLITPIVIVNGDDFAVEWRQENESVTCGQELMHVRRLRKPSEAAADTRREVRRDLMIPLAYGVHARPAARLADLAKSFSADMAMELGSRRANLRSPIAVMALGLTKGASVRLIAAGVDADAAVAAVAALVESGMDEGAVAPENTVAPAAAEPEEPGVVTGVRAAPGLALGKGLRFAHADIAVEEQGKGVAQESRRLGDAIASVRTKLSEAVHKDHSAILAAHLAFLDDPELTAEAGQSIAQGKSAGHAWRTAIQAQVTVLKGLKDARFADRAADLVDLERQVLVALGDVRTPSEISLPEGTILLADDLLPSEFVGLNSTHLAGIALVKGGATSHVAILAATMNIPVLVACGPKLLSIPDDTMLLLDSDYGKLTISPMSSLVDDASKRIIALRKAHSEALALPHQPCHTSD
ncbi:MAG TPA: glucose PTS transporter subunit IIA, partial [Rhizomicrobium sp.]|nr:glucose PTS transporter subunit IIA [Rhizomicrobium sp.]